MTGFINLDHYKQAVIELCEKYNKPLPEWFNNLPSTASPIVKNEIPEANNHTPQVKTVKNNKIISRKKS